MEKTYVFVMRNVPKSVNAKGGGVGQHHMKAHAEKKRWEGLYLMELMAARVPKNMLHCDVEVTIRWKRQNRQETHNYFQPVYKPLLDALVKGGYLPDDADKFVVPAPIRFEFPDEWGECDPRVKATMTIKLEASYR